MSSTHLVEVSPFIPCPYNTLTQPDQKNIPASYYQECVNWYEASSDVEFLNIIYTSDNLKVKGIIAQPKIISTKLPVIIYCRGGSNDDGKITVCTLKNKFYPWIKSGYIVIASQYRGTENTQGSDELGGDDVHDVINSIQITEELPYADTNSLYMIGHSRGGMMALIALRQHLPIKALALTGAVTDLFVLEQLRPDLIPLFNQMIPGMPENKQKAYAERSVTHWVNEINIPILIMHGDADTIVDVSQAHVLDDLLTKYNKKHKLIIYPQGTHSLQEHQELVNQEISTWFFLF